MNDETKKSLELLQLLLKGNHIKLTYDSSKKGTLTVNKTFLMSLLVVSWKNFWKIIDILPEVTHLKFNSNPLTYPDSMKEGWFEAFFVGIGSNCTLTHLTLHENDFNLLTKKEWDLFSQALDKNQTLHSLTLSYQNLTYLFETEDWNAMVKVLFGHKRIRFLDLSDNSFGSQMILKLNYFCDEMSKNTTIETLSLRNNDLHDLRDEEAVILSNALSKLSALKSLDLRGNYYYRQSEKSWASFCSGIAKNKTINKLAALDNRDIWLFNSPKWDPFLKAIQESQSILFMPEIEFELQPDEAFKPFREIYVSPDMDLTTLKDRRSDIKKILQEKRIERHRTALTFAHGLSNLKLKENGLPLRTLPKGVVSHILTFFDLRSLCKQVMKDVEKYLHPPR